MQTGLTNNLIYLVKLTMGNHRTMVLSILSKVFCHIIPERLKHAPNYKLGYHQAGFKKDNKFCTNHIASLRIIIKRSTEWQSLRFT